MAKGNLSHSSKIKKKEIHTFISVLACVADFRKEQLGGGRGEKLRTSKLSLSLSLLQANSYLAVDAGMKLQLLKITVDLDLSNMPF